MRGFNFEGKGVSDFPDADEHLMGDQPGRLSDEEVRALTRGPVDEVLSEMSGYEAALPTIPAAKPGDLVAFNRRHLKDFEALGVGKNVFKIISTKRLYNGVVIFRAKNCEDPKMVISFEKNYFRNRNQLR